MLLVLLCMRHQFAPPVQLAVFATQRAYRHSIHALAVRWFSGYSSSSHASFVQGDALALAQFL